MFLEVKKPLFQLRPKACQKKRGHLFKFNTTKKKGGPAKAACMIVKDCSIIQYKRKACDPQQKNSRLSQLTFDGGCAAYVTQL